jgi:hypothetical protein
MAQSNQQQVEALSEVSDIIVQISDEDLERMEFLGEQIRQFDQALGNRILEACSLLIQLNDEVESALERLEPDVDEEEIEAEDSEAAEAELDEADIEDEEDEGDERGRPRSKRRK